MALDMNEIEAGEGISTEFKREYTDEIKKTITAFANTSGGTLYIGINDDKSIIGVTNPDDTLLQITNVVRSVIKPDVTLFVGYKKETDGEKYEDVRSLNQDLSFNATEQFFETENVPFGINQQKTLRLQTTDGVYTNLGLLLSDQSVHTIKLAVFEGLEKEIFKERKEISGFLLRQLNETYEYLDIYNRTHAEVKGLVRQEKRDYPEDALREALLNALVHRDYSFSSSTLISIFDDRIEFASIGGLPKGVSLDDILLGLSVPRNENLANVFYRLHLIEAYGTGIPKIMRSYANELTKPELKATGNAFKITLPNRNIHTNKTSGKVSFTENEIKVIALFKKNTEIVRKDVESALSISQAMAVRILRGLIDKKAVKVIGEGKNIRYAKMN